VVKELDQRKKGTMHLRWIT
jgi:hypothetical protein